VATRNEKMGKVLQLKQYGKGGWEDTRGQIYKAIMAGVEFETGAMAGERIVEGLALAGSLSEKWRKVYRQDYPDYVIYSYDTPIAWHVPNDGDDGGERWVVPEVRYSPTTSRHQNLVRTALIFNQTEPLEFIADARRGHK